MVLNVKPMYTRNKYNFEQNNRKIAFTCNIQFLDLGREIILPFLRSKLQNGQFVRRL